MRISLKLEAPEGSLTLPIHYNHLVQAMIYQSLDQALAQWLHEEGFQCGKRRFKLFTFSRLLSRHRRLDLKEGTISFTGPLFLKVGAMETEILESLAVHLVRFGEVKLNGQLCRFTSVEVEMPVQASGPVLVRALSPITTYSTLFDAAGKKKTYYYNPWEREFSQKILENLQRKARAYYGEGKELPSLDGAYIRPVNVSKRNEAIINFKGLWIKGWTGLYELNLPEPYFTLAYNAGLGSKNSQGFGMVEVVKPHKQRGSE